MQAAKLRLRQLQSCLTSPFTSIRSDSDQPSSSSAGSLPVETAASGGGSRIESAEHAKSPSVGQSAVKCSTSQGSSAQLPSNRGQHSRQRRGSKVGCIQNAWHDTPSAQLQQMPKTVGINTPTDHKHDTEDDESCVVCMEAASQVVFQPCNHAVVCKVCAAKIFGQTRECPLCRCKIQGLKQLPC